MRFHHVVTVSYFVHVVCLTHLEPEAHIGVQGEMTLGPYLVGRLCAFCFFPTRGGSGLGKLGVGHEDNSVEGLEETDDHERYLAVCKL